MLPHFQEGRRIQLGPTIHNGVCKGRHDNRHHRRHHPNNDDQHNCWRLVSAVHRGSAQSWVHISAWCACVREEQGLL